MRYNIDMKTILHCDANNFYASVECMERRDLQGVPVAVCGDPQKRHGIILAKNDLAKKAGVKTAETIRSALNKCPELKLVEPHFEKYVAVSDSIFDIYNQYTDLVEPFGIDEGWLDVTPSVKLFGDGVKIADALRERIKKEIGLTISVGVSFTKIFAKLGSDMKKPDATTVISKDNFRQLIWPLPASEMLMVGGRTYAALLSYGIRTIGDLANADKTLLAKKLGVNGEKLISYARGEEGEDVREYCNGRVHKSIGHSTTMPKDVTSREECAAVIFALSEMVAARLRKAHSKASGVSVSLRYNDLTHRSRQCIISPATDSAGRIAEEATALLDTFYREGRDKPLRGLGVSVFDLNEECGAVQESLFDMRSEKEDEASGLTRSIDAIRSKYGFDSIRSATLIKNLCICDDLDGDKDFLPFNKNAKR